MKRLFLAFVASLMCFSTIDAQQWAVTTNLAALADLGTLNVEAAYSPAQHWTLDAGVKYNPFTYGRGEGQFQQRHQTWWAGARWWPWHSYAGWWLSGKVQYQEYNFGGIFSDRTEEGDKAGFGVTAGYTYMLTSHLNMEFGLGLWGGYKWYAVYACPKCGMKLDSGSKPFVLPNDLMIAISYVF
ncbi:MAG: DUF3575 domain-containing protein [Bacteroidales bacterium]|nr:DUF3575 domain-containing protein [Bacteroidales bacterium]